jgi:hypothetical protein
VISRCRAPRQIAHALASLAIGALLALAPLTPGQAAGPSRDDDSVAIGRVRDVLQSRGRPAGGPMDAALVHPYAPPDELGRAWIVVSDDGVWLVWGAVSGPLGPEETQMLLAICMCEFTLPAPARLAKGASPPAF